MVLESRCLNIWNIGLIRLTGKLMLFITRCSFPQKPFRWIGQHTIPALGVDGLTTCPVGEVEVCRGPRGPDELAGGGQATAAQPWGKLVF